MLDLKPSTDEEKIIDPPQILPSPEEIHKRRMPLVWIPATISVGLLIAAVYLGGRIVTAQPHTQSAARVAVSVQPPPPPPIAAPKADAQPQTPDQVPQAQPNAQPVVDEDPVPMITPKEGERYIQVGALDQESTRRFVQRLRNENLDPHVVPGPKPQLLRVLIGPFQDRDSLKERETQLQAEGLENFARKY
jgi:cell division septation protein DedD